MQQFKVGDWVQKVDNQGIAYSIEKVEFQDRADAINSYTVNLPKDRFTFRHWQPKESEWCWFFKKDSSNPIFAQFIRFINTNLGIYEASGYTPNGTDSEDKLEFGYFFKCEPFIAETFSSSSSDSYSSSSYGSSYDSGSSGSDSSSSE